jgi:hypothetical protein
MKELLLIAAAIIVAALVLSPKDIDISAGYASPPNIMNAQAPPVSHNHL